MKVGYIMLLRMSAFFGLGCENLVLLVVWKILVWRMGLEEKPNFEILEVGIMGWGSIVDQNHSLYHDGENNNVVLSRLLLAQNIRGKKVILTIFM